MKIIAIDNGARESVADRLVAANVPEVEGKIMCDALRATCDGNSAWYYNLVEDDHRLSKGMEDLV